MKTFYKKSLILAVLLTSSYACAQLNSYNSENFSITEVSITHHEQLAATSWQIRVKGKAGATTPVPAGQLDGAPVLGYVFPTTLKPTDVGFNNTEGIVALALTSHPDFDDTPLWDENNDMRYDNDGIIWHPHWVVLVPDDRVEGGLSVKQFKKEDKAVVLPPTNPGMPMYMDSPGYAVHHKDNHIQVLVPDYRINHKTDFSFDGVAVFMKVNTSNDELPLLGVYNVYSVASGDLSLPYQINRVK